MPQLNDDLLLGDLIVDEGKRSKVYLCPAGKHTIGIGRNLDDLGLSADEEIYCEAKVADLIAGKELTDPQIRYLCRNDIARCKRELTQSAPWWTNMPEPAQRGLANMLFNMGWTRLSGFKNMLGALKSGLYSAAASHALDSAWSTQVGPRATRIADLFKSCVGGVNAFTT